GCQADVVADRDGAGPVAPWLVEDEAAVGLHRAAEIDGPARELARAKRNVDALEELPEVELERPVDHDSERAALVVLRDEDHRAVEHTSELQSRENLVCRL